MCVAGRYHACVCVEFIQVCMWTRAVVSKEPDACACIYACVFMQVCLLLEHGSMEANVRAFVCVCAFVCVRACVCV